MKPKMLKNLTTSSRISLKFTLFTIVIVFIFRVLANLIFFRMWYGGIKMEIDPSKAPDGRGFPMENRD
jgi:hypothetical protein